jgi:hypothetical protein
MSRKIHSDTSHTKFQRFLSFFVLFFFLFNTTFQIPISVLESVFASDSKYYDLVAILVSETIYEDIESEVSRYGKDIQ